MAGRGRLQQGPGADSQTGKRVQNFATKSGDDVLDSAKPIARITSAKYNS